MEHAADDCSYNTTENIYGEWHISEADSDRWLSRGAPATSNMKFIVEKRTLTSYGKIISQSFPWPVCSHMFTG